MMQLDQNMLNRLLTMNDSQLAGFIGEIARGAGIDPSELGLNPQNMAELRRALGGATSEDLAKMNAVYEEYRRQKRKP